MSLPELFSRKLLIVSGKGGVGKTTLSLALALAAARVGKKVLLAEIQSQEQVAQLLNRPPIGYREVSLLPKVWGINIQPLDSFKEYVLRQIRLETLYHAVFENKLVRNFIEGTPGMAELMCIGKVSSLLERYDLTIVDAPASGHSVALLEVASIVSSATRVGPLKSESEKIDRILHDAKRTSLLFVSIPEEMPVAETVETSRWLRERLDLPIRLVFLNQFQPPTFSSQESLKLNRLAPVAVSLRMAQSRRSELYQKRLARSLPGVPIVPIPFLYARRFGVSEIEKIAGQIGESL